MDSHILFSKTPPLKLFFLTAIPGAISMLSSSLFQMIDGIFVGHFLGKTAFAAINLAIPFVYINFALADLIGVGSSVPISISLGRKEEDEANNIFTCSCLMTVATGILVGGLLFALAPLIIGLMGAKGEFASLAVQYIRVYALCSPFTTIFFGVDNYLRICGKIRSNMFLNILMCILTVSFEFVFLSIFKWNMWSAAFATCLSMFICSVIAFVPFIRGKLQLRFCKPQFNIKMIKQIVLCGSPNFLNTAAGRITSILINTLLVRFGGEAAVSVYGILMYIDNIVQSLLYGTCDALQPSIGYNWGASKYSRARAMMKYGFTAGAILSVISLFIIFVFPAQITELFIKNASAELTIMAIGALKIFSITYITKWISFATQGFMLAVEKSNQATIISISNALIFPLLLVALLWPFKLTGLWLNMPITSILVAFLAVVLLFKSRKYLLQPDTQ